MYERNTISDLLKFAVEHKQLSLWYGIYIRWLKHPNIPIYDSNNNSNKERKKERENNDFEVFLLGYLSIFQSNIQIINAYIL